MKNKERKEIKTMKKLFTAMFMLASIACSSDKVDDFHKPLTFFVPGFNLKTDTPSVIKIETQIDKNKKDLCDGLLFMLCVKSATCDAPITTGQCLVASSMFHEGCMNVDAERVKKCIVEFADTKCGETAPESCIQL